MKYEDLGHLHEDVRLSTIVDALKLNPGKVVGIVVERGKGFEGKGDRYIAHVKSKLPNVILMDRLVLPLPPDGKTELIKFRLPHES